MILSASCVQVFLWQFSIFHTVDAEADLQHMAVGQVDESSEIFRKSQQKTKVIGFGK